MSNLLDSLTTMLWAIRIVGLAVGIYTIRYLYKAVPGTSPCRAHAGRISGAIVLWIAAVFINAFLAQGNETMRAVGIILLDISPMIFCLSIIGIAKNESQHQTS